MFALCSQEEKRKVLDLEYHLQGNGPKDLPSLYEDLPPKDSITFKQHQPEDQAFNIRDFGGLTHTTAALLKTLQ
jgi:hypothetical protein